MRVVIINNGGDRLTSLHLADILLIYRRAVLAAVSYASSIPLFPLQDNR